MTNSLGVKIHQRKVKNKRQKRELEAIRRRIKKLMIDKNLSESKIARILGTSPQMICDVIARRKNAPRYEEGIADLLGVSRKRLFR